MINQWQRKDYLFYAVIVVAIFFLRNYGLDIRPLHHDESLHGAYSFYFYQDPLTGYYKYNPLLHGPFLYHIVPWFYWIFGITKYAIRLPGLMASISLLFIPLFLKKHFSKSTVFFLLAFLATSPTLTYWSRFIRHDSFVLLSFTLFIFALNIRNTLLKTFFFATSLAIHLTCKENFYIHSLFLITFLIFEAFINREHCLLRKVSHWIKSHLTETAIGLLIFIFITTYYYSGSFQYPQGVKSLLTGKAFSYWFDQHHRERISGPFSYTFIINFFFEAWWLPALVISFIQFYRSRIRDFFRIILPCWIICTLLILNHTYMFSVSIENFCSSILKLKISLDYFLFFTIIPHAVLGTFVFAKALQNVKAVLHFTFFATFFTYSYLGEKVPWLALYPCFAALLYFAYLLNEKRTKLVYFTLITSLALNIYNSYWTNWTHQSDPFNLLTQVHTSKDFENNLFKIQNFLRRTTSFKPKILARFETTWPTTWFVHGFPGYHYGKTTVPTPKFDYVLTQPHDEEARSLLSPTHEKLIIPLRSWWLPDYKEITLLQMLGYSFFKKTWGKAGHQYTAIWKRKTIAR